MAEIRHPMPQRPGAHAAYARRGELVVEWYDFGEDAPYESANLIVFDAAAQRELAGRLGADPAICADELAALVASRFGSYFEARQFAADHAIAFRAEVDFTP